MTDLQKKPKVASKPAKKPKAGCKPKASGKPKVGGKPKASSKGAVPPLNEKNYPCVSSLNATDRAAVVKWDKDLKTEILRKPRDMKKIMELSFGADKPRAAIGKAKCK